MTKHRSIEFTQKIFSVHSWPTYIQIFDIRSCNSWIINKVRFLKKYDLCLEGNSGTDFRCVYTSCNLVEKLIWQVKKVAMFLKMTIIFIDKYLFFWLFWDQRKNSWEFLRYMICIMFWKNGWPNLKKTTCD